MKFKEVYTTADLKAMAKPEEKEIEDKKRVVSNDAYLNAEMTQTLINSLEKLRLKL